MKFSSFLEANKMKGDDPCWKGYKMVGKKTKNGKQVPNCVPVDEAVKTADRKPQMFTDPEGKKRVRMVPVDSGAIEETDLKEAKGTGVKKFVRGMRVAKTSNPDMKGTVIKGGDNMKKSVEVEWDSGTTTMASGKYLMSISKNESVELEEWQKETPWRKSPEQRKDKYGNVIKTKNIAKHLAKAAQKQTAKEDLDELSINTLKSYRKKAVDDVASNKKADQRAKGVAKASNKIYRKEFDALYNKESTELDEMDLSKHDTKKLLQFHRKYADRKMGPSDANTVRAVRRELIKRGVSIKEEVELDEATYTPEKILGSKPSQSIKSKDQWVKAAKGMGLVVKSPSTTPEGNDNKDVYLTAFDKQGNMKGTWFKTHGVFKESVEIDEAKSSGDALMAYAKKSGGIDKASLMKLAGKLQNHSETGNPSTMADIVKMVKGMDTEPRDQAMTIIQKNDPAMYKSIVRKARLAESNQSLTFFDLRSQLNEKI